MTQEARFFIVNGPGSSSFDVCGGVSFALVVIRVHGLVLQQILSSEEESQGS